MCLGGYSIECLLKSKLMQKLNCRTLDELDGDRRGRGLIAATATMFTHQIESLLRVSGSLDRLRLDSLLWPSFTIVNRWIPAWRYDPDLSREEVASVFLAAIDRISSWIRSNI